MMVTFLLLSIHTGLIPQHNTPCNTKRHSDYFQAKPL